MKKTNIRSEWKDNPYHYNHHHIVWINDKGYIHDECRSCAITSIRKATEEELLKALFEAKE